MIAEMDDALARIELATTPTPELPAKLVGLCRWLRYHAPRLISNTAL
jgi:hypothetical protein